MYKLEEIFSQFKTDGEYVRAGEIGSGHLNDTFLVETSRKPFYVLQRVNHFVFKEADKVIENKVAVSEYLLKKLAHLPKEELEKKVMIFIKTKEDKSFYKDSDGNFWNLMLYIENSVSYEKVPNEQIAFEGGKVFSEFLYLTKGFDSAKLYTPIPNFHSMSKRFEQFDEALQSASEKRKKEAKDSISLVKKRREEMHRIENLINENKIPIRLTHNDTKISNALFSKDDKALCVIDTDTIMEGAIHFDFGDAIRTICNTAYEDESDLLKVGFNLNFYKAFVKGFFSTPTKNAISQTEADNLAFSAKVMTFIVGLRMLTDFLNNDVYFKTKYDLHNLDRAKNQFKLVSQMDERFDEMKSIVQSEFTNAASAKTD